MREELGLAYSVYSFSSSYVDSGIFGIYAGTNPKSVGELIETICGELLSISRNISISETNRARAQLKSGLLMSLESTGTRCEQMARQLLLFGRPLLNSEVIKKIDSIDPDQLMTVAGRLISTSNPTVTALGPIDKMPDYGSIKQKFC